jgi:hypothetical protein
VGDFEKKDTQRGGGGGGERRKRGTLEYGTIKQFHGAPPQKKIDRRERDGGGEEAVEVEGEE